jgi:hypothetical protein
MTTLAPSTLGSSIDPNRPKRPRWLIVTTAVVVLAIIGAGLGWLVYAHT